MNSRRPMRPPQPEGLELPHRYVKTLLCITAKFIVKQNPCSFDHLIGAVPRE
jgi:hypothetical protein